MIYVKGYEGLYAVTSCGKVWSYRKNGFLNICKKSNGYSVVNLTKDGKHKTFTVHRLVAEAYLRKPLGATEVNHKDENKNNNCVNNLEWCNHAYNMNYSKKKIYKNAGRKTNSKSKNCVCIETGELFRAPIEIAKKFGVRYYVATACCRNQLNNINGFHFKYV